MPRAAAAAAAAKFAKLDDDAAFEAAMKADDAAAAKRKAEQAARPKKKRAPKPEPVEYEIEAILDVKKASHGDLVFLIKWKGYDDESENTWEPEDEDSVPFAEYIAANEKKVEAARAAEPEAAEDAGADDDEEDEDEDDE